MFRNRRRPSSSVSNSSGAAPDGAPRGPSLLGRRRSFSSHDGAASGEKNGRSVAKNPALIQRLIILHDGLMPLPAAKQAHHVQPRRRNPELSEDASLDEHGEFILYYYDHSLHFDGRRTPIVQSREARRRHSNESDASAQHHDGEAPRADHATEEAVRFAGLCRALRSLPLALQPDEGSHLAMGVGGLSETDVVHLKESTLVFVPLELGGDVVAVAQIPRADNRQLSPGRGGRSGMGFGADPEAMTEAIRRIHAAFSLLRGGGIHRRLLRTQHLEGSKDWVLEVTEDEPREESSTVSSNSGSKDSLNRKNSLLVKDDSVWEVGGAEQPEMENEASHKKERRRSRKSRSTKKLSSSFGMDNIFSSIYSATTGNNCRSNVDDGEYRYGGMEELFALRREQRKLSHKLKEDNAEPRFGGFERNAGRWGSNKNAEDLFNDIADDFGHNDCERRIENLLNILPISQLRRDLVQFYDERLRRLQGACEAMRGGAGRCVVEMVPPPLGHSTMEPVRGQHPPLAPHAFVCLAASEFMKSLMQQKGAESKEYGRLFGMSLFYEGRLVLSEIPPSNTNEAGPGVLPPEIPNMIAEHFLSSHNQEHEHDEKSAQNGDERAAQNGSDAPLVRWMSNLSVGAARNEVSPEAPKRLASDVSNANASNEPSLGYITPRERSGETLTSLYVRTIKRQVWLPHVHLPYTLGFNAPCSDDDEPDTHVAMFRGGELSFLLFFEIPAVEGTADALAIMARELQPRPAVGTRTTARSKRQSKNVSETTQAFADLLASLSGELTEFCETHSSREADPNSKATAPLKDINSDALFPGERGMDIVYIDRGADNFILLSQHDLSSSEIKRIAPKNDGTAPNANGINPIFGLFGGGSKLKDETSHGQPCRPSKYKSMLDCRHKLAAYLPLDVLLAFDDMFGEIERKRDQDDAMSSALDGTGSEAVGSIELCTFLPEGWVYGRAHGNIELYILLDTSKFVTINDVQKAVTRVRERLLNDKIR